MTQVKMRVEPLTQKERVCRAHRMVESVTKTETGTGRDEMAFVSEFSHINQNMNTYLFHNK